MILHLIIAELSYNNGGVQLVKSFEGELFHRVVKKIFSWVVFVVYGLAIMLGVSGNINGGARIFTNWFGMPIALCSMVVFATSANQAVIQVVKGLDGNPGKIRKTIFIASTYGCINNPFGCGALIPLS